MKNKQIKECTCGSPPNGGFTKEDWRRKEIAMSKCPVHNKSIKQPKVKDWQQIYFKIKGNKLLLAGDGMVELSDYLKQQKKEIIDEIAKEEGWEETREYYIKKLLNKGE